MMLSRGAPRYRYQIGLTNDWKDLICVLTRICTVNPHSLSQS